MQYSQMVSCLLMTCFTASFVAQAQEQDKKLWSGQSELGYVLTAGNTETQTLNAKLKLNNNINAWENVYALEALNASQNEVTSAEKYNVKAQGNRLFTSRDYGFGVLNYDDDRFSGFDYEATTALGYGRKIMDDQNIKLSLEAGPGARVSKIADASSESEGIVRAAANFAYLFSETSSFEQSLTVEGGEDRTISKSVSSLSSKIAGSLAMKLSLAVKHNSEPAILLDTPLKKTDTESAATLVYGF